MRVKRPLLMFLACIITCNSNAGELTLEPHAMLYFRMSLDGGQAEHQQHAFGLRIDRALVEKGKPIDYRQLFRQPAIMDFNLNSTGTESLTIAGVDYLKKYRALRAAEEDGAVVEGDSASSQEGAEEAGAPAAEESVEAPAEDTAADETAAEDESVAAEEDDGEDRKILPSYSDLFKENQRFGLIVGGILLAGFVIGMGD